MRTFLGGVLCRIGFHKYEGTPILADLDNLWVQGGKVCSRYGCGTKKISFDDAARFAKYSYEKGKERQRAKFLAYGNGVKEVVDLYGKEYVINLVNGHNRNNG